MVRKKKVLKRIIEELIDLVQSGELDEDDLAYLKRNIQPIYFEVNTKIDVAENEKRRGTKDDGTFND